MPLLVNNGRILKNNRKILQSIASLAFLTDQERFLKTFNAVAPSNIYMQFITETTVYVQWGDGSPLEAFKTKRIDSNSPWAVRFYDRIAGDTHPAYVYDIPTHVFIDSQPLHTVRIFYQTRQLQIYTSDNRRLVEQDLAFGFAQHTNMTKFTISDHRTNAGKGAILNLDVHNTYLLDFFTELGLSNSFADASPFYRAIPADLITKTLITLNCGEVGYYNTGQSFDQNNLNKIVQAKDSLQTLNLYGGGLLADTNPVNTNPNYPQPDSGPMPVSFAQLTALVTLNVHHTLYTVIPAIINQMPWLQILNLTSSHNLAGWGDLSALVNLKAIIIADCYAISTTVPAWFANLTSLITLNMGSCFPAVGAPGYRVNEIDTWVSNLYAFVTAPGRIGWRNMNFNIGPYPSRTADKVSAASDTKLQDLTTNYGWTCTYNK